MGAQTDSVEHVQEGGDVDEVLLVGGGVDEDVVHEGEGAAVEGST